MPTPFNEAWISAELAYPGALALGSPDLANVKRLQEWLSLRGYKVLVDGDFGPATKKALADFQKKQGSAGSGTLGPQTWKALIDPMASLLSAHLTLQTTSYVDAVEKLAFLHLKQHPIEVGGQNRGPWVRLYTKGNQGAAFPWCAGFVSFVMMQASLCTGTPMPLDYTLSCDLLAADAKRKGRFIAQASLTPAKTSPCGLFLVRKTNSDWTHTGFATKYNVSRGKVTSFETIEGNTNDSGDREGYEVCKRYRGVPGRDFIRIDV
ncbi:MAG: peptidoglycan-binding protein [Rhodothermales bacterium]|nr:peptidoglycan-binding protein [Rhodothermales bacterium]